VYKTAALPLSYRDSICSLGDRAELVRTRHVAQFIPTRLAQADLALFIVAELFTASIAFHRLAPRAGFEPAHFLSNSQVPYQLGYLGTTWWAITELNCALSIKSRVLRRQSL
jgi:hypothetical protein